MLSFLCCPFISTQCFFNYFIFLFLSEAPLKFIAKWNSYVLKTQNLFIHFHVNIHVFSVGINISINSFRCVFSPIGGNAYYLIANSAITF